MERLRGRALVAVAAVPATPVPATAAVAARAAGAEATGAEQAPRLVVLLALGRIGEHGVRLGDPLEPLLGLRVARIRVRVQLAGHPAGRATEHARCGGLLAAITPLSWQPDDASLPAYIIIGATSLGITALPVLALIIRDLGVEESPEAKLAVSSAAASDLVAWILLGVAVALQTGTGWQGILVTLATLAGVCLLSHAVARPLLLRFAARVDERVAVGLIIGITLSLVAAGAQAHAHLTIVSLLFGLMLEDPEGRLRECLDRMTTANLLLLMPFFTVELGLAFTPGPILRSPAGIASTVLLTVVALTSKQAGAVLGGARSSTAVRCRLSAGALSGAKGITELLLLSVAMDAGIIGPDLYAMGVVMALLATACAAPLWRLSQVAPLQRPARKHRRARGRDKQKLNVGLNPESARSILEIPHPKEETL